MAHPVWSLLAPLVAPWPLVFARQNATPPPKPYAVVDVRSVVPLGTIVAEPAANGEVRISGPVLLRVEVNLFGPGGEAKARTVALMLRAPSAVQVAAGLGMGVARTVGITNATAFADEPQFEERSILEITVNATDGVTVPGDNIEHVVIEPDPTAEPPWATCGEVISAPDAITPPPTP